MRRFALMLALACATALPAVAQQQSAGKSPHPAALPEVLVIGVYHMANPGRDIFSTKADDVLVPKRQAEMARLVEVLKRFHPTKIVEHRSARCNSCRRHWALRRT